MVKNYVEHLADTYLEYYKELKDSQKEVNTNVDKLSVWPVSLATGAVVLIFSIDKSKTLLGSDIINWGLILYTVTILAGVFSRLFSIWSIRQFSDLNSGFLFNTLMEKYPNKGFKLHGNESAWQIYIMLQESFKVDYPFIIKGYEDMTESEMQVFDEIAREFYEGYVEFSQSESQRAMEKFDIITEISFGYKDGYFKEEREKRKLDAEGYHRKKNRKTMKVANSCLMIHKILYMTSFISFSIATILLIVSLV